MARKKGHWQSERCTVCRHPKIGIINFALARGIAPLAVANEHGLGTSAVYNHNRVHIADNYRKIIGSGVYADIDELLKKCTQGALYRLRSRANLHSRLRSAVGGYAVSV